MGNTLISQQSGAEIPARVVIETGARESGRPRIGRASAELFRLLAAVAILTLASMVYPLH
jgi:hypothetical protein